MGLQYPVPFLIHKIMNELARIVSSVLTGSDRINIVLGGRFYKVSSPTPYTIAKMLNALYGIKQSDTISFDEIVKNIPDNVVMISKAIAVCVYSNCSALYNYRVRKLSNRIMKCNSIEIREAFEEIIKSINATDFFYCAQSAKTMTGIMAKQKPKEETR